MRFDRFGAQDTSEETQELMYALLRKKTPEEKLLMVIDRMEFMRQLRASTAHLRRPDEPDRTDL